MTLKWRVKKQKKNDLGNSFVTYTFYPGNYSLFYFRKNPVRNSPLILTCSHHYTLTYAYTYKTVRNSFSGADTVIFERLRKGQEDLINKTQEHLDVKIIFTKN
jgi:hypothetical protein